MVLRSRGLRQARVRDLADEDVLEAERLLAGDRRALLVRQEIAQHEVVQRVLDLLAEVGRQMRKRARPEDPSDHRRALQQEFLARRQTIDARGDQCLQRVRNAIERTVAALEHHAHRLFDEERIAFRLINEVRAYVRR